MSLFKNSAFLKQIQKIRGCFVVTENSTVKDGRLQFENPFREVTVKSWVQCLTDARLTEYNRISLVYIPV